MPDTKITALAAITTVDPAADVLPIVDISDTSMAASGTTKKITSNQILGAGGTATLASATISGDLTVDTNVLKVDTTLNRVGVGTASPSGIFHAANLGTAGTTADNFNGYFSSANRNCSIYLLAKNTEGSNFYFGDGDNNTVGGIIYDHTSNYMRFDANGSEQMRLNANGLGIGVTPSAWLAAVKALDIGSQAMGVFSGGITHNAYFDNTDSRWEYKGNGAATYWNIQGGVHQWYVAASGIANNPITTFSSAAMTLDASGRLLVGPTSANASGGVLQLSSGITFPATQVASADANTLDDYEEGNWVGTLTGGTTNPTTPVTATGRYTKIGRVVTVQIFYSNISTVGASGAIAITGLPFANNGTVQSNGSVSLFQIGTFTGSPFAIIDVSASSIDIQSNISAANYGSVTHNAGTGRYMTISITYTVA